ncbi:plasmid pRiA4b ORF-3 family protein [Pontiella sulfatireligans]|uniref:Plasmid pRiA4b Orf3-like domain-containing protein n=1 Tax=Pontiella sulfatireligans TaxID=2750658 RepID=A0A6C2UIJ7_9BACT|nr:plasmid pRiA4b ORF-3 family protein [Pontiella sulfatireligans]VGO20035.1 hypothetical protein SCARR_02095 [Pontiella sulfatireligans]
MKQDELLELVDDYGRLAESEFSLADLVGHVQCKGVKASEDEIFDIAMTSDYLLEADSLNEIFVPRRTFFQGAQFRITPLKAEIEGGYVVPGHRFFPFVSREVFPADARLVLPDGAALQTRTVSLPQAQAMPFLHFCGFAGAMEYLLLDHEGNMEKLMPPFDADVELTVFDLRGYFAASGFRPGDSLMLTVVDWLQGVFSIVRAENEGARVDAVAAKKWIASMAGAMGDALDELGTDGDCYEQLALALCNAQGDPKCIPLMKAPPLALATYFNLQKDLTVKMVGDRALFWDVDEDPQEEAVFDALENPSEPESELDAYFQQLGLSISEAEVEAYMRDALCHEGKSPEDVLARVAEGRTLFFASAEDQEEFHDLWCVLWDEVQQDYSREADPFGEIRTSFLALNDKAFAVMRQLDARGLGMEIMDNPAFMEFSQLTAMISSALAMFNIPETAHEALPNPLEGMTGQFDLAIDELANRLLQDAPKQGAAPAGDGIYQLKVSLKGAKPPIWRRILVPSATELNDLHYIIQATMGWKNCHLYQFKQGGTFYLPDPEDDFMGFGGFDTEDSAGVRIGVLLRKEKQKIVYEYDFGDSWVHEILLEKITEPEDGLAYPICIKGMRACPPEDCGGLWGYYNLLEILDHPKCEEYEQMLEWVGGKIDPEAFDLAAANARMRQRFD